VFIALGKKKKVPLRLWSVHPQYLDVKGLVALWREGLLARKVLHGETRGYTKHPQLERFQATKDPKTTIDLYLHHVVDEADRRGYNFNRTKLGPRNTLGLLPVKDGQFQFERNHLHHKLETRDPERAVSQHKLKAFEPHPLFEIIEGPIASWERP
jgi:hypothetical protein